MGVTATVQATGTWVKRKFTTGVIQRSTAALWMNFLVAVPLAVAFFTVWGGLGRAVTPEELSVAALKIFAVWCLSFLPGWLYVRFLGQRAGALWNEYVLNLHRLGLDDPQHLPQPPRSSGYYREWEAQGGARLTRQSNLYQQKFIAYYGRSVPEAAARASEEAEEVDERTAQRTNFAVRGETMFPVFLATAVFSAMWVAILWDTSFLESPATVWDVLKFALLGAYAFIAQALIRRFFQSDLRPTAYTSAVLRIVFVLVITATLHAVLSQTVDVPTEAAAAFVIGFFPVVGIQVLQRAAAALLKVVVPQLAPAYPLSEVDGLNLWYETRLVEEGIEDMENLATANLVDVMLHTRVPVGRLIDWKDQAHLYLHLDRTEHGLLETLRARRGAASDHASPLGSGPRLGTRTRVALRQLGIRNATDLLKAFPPDVFDTDSGGPQAEQMTRALHSVDFDPDQMRTVVRVLSHDTGLIPVLNWQRRGIGLREVPRQRQPEDSRVGARRADGNGAATSSPTNSWRWAWNPWRISAKSSHS